MVKNTRTQFAAYDNDGNVSALVADGLPEWPADNTLTGLTDTDLGAMHDAYVEEARAMSADGATIDPARAAELGEHIVALRNEAATRLATPPAVVADADPANADALAALNAILDAPEVTPPAVEVAPEGATLTVLEVQPIDTAGIAAAAAEGVAAGLAPVLEGITALSAALTARPTVPAVPRRATTAAELSGYRPDAMAPIATETTGRRPRGKLVHTGEVPGTPMGAEIESLSELTNMFVRRHRDIGQSMGDEEKVLIASYVQDDIPESRDLRTMTDSRAVKDRIRKVVGTDAMGVDPWNLGRELPISQGGVIVDNPDAMVASGGLAAPVEPYYGQLVIAESDRPFMNAMPSFVADRGGIRLVLPPSLGTLTAVTQPGLFADGVANGTTTFTSATAAFTAADVGKQIVNAGSSTLIPAGTIINSVTNGTTVVLSAAATGSGTAQSFYIASRNPNVLGGAVGLVTAAQDAAGSPATYKFTYDVPNGTQAEFDVYSVYTSLQFANLTARTFPEQVEANILLANALAARVSEQKAMDVVTGWSTLFTFAKTFGTARQLLAQFDHMAAYYRNHNRMNPRVVLRLVIPAWVLNAMRGDLVATPFLDIAAWGMSEDEITQWFQDRRILPSFYWDSPSDVQQLFASPGSGAININGVNNATPIAAPDYPGTGATSSFRTNVVSFMWAEGTWLGLTTGELNVGLVRDSILNAQNRFRSFEELWETPAFVGVESLRCVHTVASDGTYAASSSVTLGVGSGL